MRGRWDSTEGVYIAVYDPHGFRCDVLTKISQTRTEPHQSRPIDLRHLPGLRKHEILLAAHASIGRRPRLDRGHRGLMRHLQPRQMAYIDRRERERPAKMAITKQRKPACTVNNALEARDKRACVTDWRWSYEGAYLWQVDLRLRGALRLLGK
jgi:phytoene dehydrogenase-like protein